MSNRVGVMIVVWFGLSIAAGVAVADKAKQEPPPGKAEPPDKADKPDRGEHPAKKPAKGKRSKAAKPAPEEPAPVEEPAPEAAWFETVPHVTGPKLVDLGHEVQLDVPDGFVLFERAQAQEMMRKGGDDADSVIGALIKPGTDWLVVVEYDGIGYVSDDDADELHPAELLESYRQGTLQQNTRRKALGVAELFIDGWSEQPRYERAKRHLVWGLNAHSTEGPVINYFTRILGRGGFISLNLIDAPATIEKSKAEAGVLLTATRFNAGGRYEDYREGDKSSGIGLKALVLGGAGIATVKAAKAGIIVTILLALKKGIVVVVLAIAGFFKLLLGRKKAAPVVVDEDPRVPSDDPPSV